MTIWHSAKPSFCLLHCLLILLCLFNHTRLTATMPPKRSTRSSTRASQNGKDSKQPTLEGTGDGVIDTSTGEKRPAPDEKETISADDKKDGTRANKKQKQEAAAKSKIQGGADELDEKSEQAKADGREIMENTETKKPGRGTLEKGTVYFWYKPKGGYGIDW